MDGQVLLSTKIAVKCINVCVTLFRWSSCFRIIAFQFNPLSSGNLVILAVLPSVMNVKEIRIILPKCKTNSFRNNTGFCLLTFSRSSVLPVYVKEVRDYPTLIFLVCALAEGKRKSLLLHYLGQIGKPAELKHIIKRRKRNQQVIPPVLANEQGIALYLNRFTSCNLEFRTFWFRILG